MIRMPAEWEQQSAVLIAWPHHTGDFGHMLEQVEMSYCFIANTISRFQRLLIVCRDDIHQQHIQALLGRGQAHAIDFIHAIIDDIWVRDTVFLSVEVNQRLLLTNFRFNGWGGKYPYKNDDALNDRLLEHKPFLGSSVASIDYILEGGSIESDGQGTLLTTRQCLLNPNRNKELSQPDIEMILAQHLGATRVLWLDQENLAGDDTDAHIDTLARFCSADTIAYTACDDPTDSHYAGLKKMEMQLKAFKTHEDQSYRLVPLPMPQPLFNSDGKRLPANYANFLIINQAVMVPIYDDPMDSVALDRLGACFPTHQMIATPCRPLVHQYGSLHCMTMQFPDGVLFF